MINFNNFTYLIICKQIFNIPIVHEILFFQFNTQCVRYSKSKTIKQLILHKIYLKKIDAPLDFNPIILT